MDDLLKNIYSDNSPATTDPLLFNHGRVSSLGGRPPTGGTPEGGADFGGFPNEERAVREEDVRIGGGGGGEQGVTADAAGI
ncbi:hypothetical protein NL676_021528 [Syzygium grande]|nr:hypothetical protein NL676_021528 [Syzygium grande]